MTLVPAPKRLAVVTGVRFLLSLPAVVSKIQARSAALFSLHLGPHALAKAIISDTVA